MLELGNNLKLEKRKSSYGDTWVCLELTPADTWKNRQHWKPLTRPLQKTEVLAWIGQHCSATESADQIRHYFD